MTSGRRSKTWLWSLWIIRIVTAVGLAVDAYVHWDLAPVYAEVRGTINEGVLFRAEAVVALLAAVAVIATGRRAAYLAGLAVGASALTVLLVARYVDLGRLGPSPTCTTRPGSPRSCWRRSPRARPPLRRSPEP